jgi:ribosomal silencing factor RsfS
MPNLAEAARALGYDDEQLAAKIIEMEVDGVIDETWQEGPRAHSEDVQSLCSILRDIKVADVVAICTKDKTSSFDYMIFGTCSGARHIGVAAWAISEADRHERVSKPRRRKTDDEWEVVTCGRILVNLMQQGYRERVFLERKWALTENTDPMAFARSPISEGRDLKMHGLWTLTVNLQDLEDFEVDYCKEALLRQR